MPNAPKFLVAIAAVALTFGPRPRAAWAEEPQEESPPCQGAGKAADLAFLKVGAPYKINFPESHHPALRRVSEASDVTITTEDKSTGRVLQAEKRRITWDLRFQIDVFVVRELRPGPWALLEHPTDPKATMTIMSARRRVADPKEVARLGSTEEGRAQLTALRTEAARRVETTRTWVNLNHASSISDPPKDGDEGWDFRVRYEGSTAGKRIPPKKQESAETPSRR